MENGTLQNVRTAELLLNHYQRYPKLKAQDIFKYIFQSTYGCEHMLTNETAALDYVNREYSSLNGKSDTSFLTERLDGEYSRVFLSSISNGLKPKTLARLFCLSAKKEKKGIEELLRKLEIAKKLVLKGKIPLNINDFDKSIKSWANMGYPAIHHSDEFRSEYSPAYRVISNCFSAFLPLFTEIDKLEGKDRTIIAIEGGSASGKSTLAKILEEVYSCNVFHMDDFFLRPEQRTQERLAEIGGNIDRERFKAEILQPILENEPINYRPFNCRTQSLGEPINIAKNRLTVIEGVYSMHPKFEKYYDVAVFLEIDEDLQQNRILKRNSPQLAERFFCEWIPMENKYFSHNAIKARASIIFSANDAENN